MFLQFVVYSLSIVGILKNEIPGDALEIWQWKIEQFSPGILKFSTKHKDNPLRLNIFKVFHAFLFTFHAGSLGLGLKNFRNSSYKKKAAGSARVSRLSFRFLWLWYKTQLSLQKVILLKLTFLDHTFTWLFEYGFNDFIKRG